MFLCGAIRVYKEATLADKGLSQLGSGPRGRRRGIRSWEADRMDLEASACGAAESSRQQQTLIEVGLVTLVQISQA